MKKALLIALVVGLMSSSSFAASFVQGWSTGKISRIAKNSNGKMVIYVIPTGGSAANEVLGVLNLTGDARKEFLAIVLTAKASGNEIKLYESGTQWLYFSY